MDTGAIYELRERLRAAAMAGTNLLSEDFRLKRAYEAFKPLENTSPVFAKVGQLTEQLLSPNCQNVQGALLDTITLADAVICTLGTVDLVGEVESVGAPNLEEYTGSLIVNAPYSALKELLEALTTSGGGHYGYVCDIHERHPELFRDYRVKNALVQALGAPYAELADQAERWMIEENDKTVLPVLYRDFDPKGKKEMVRRVKVISALAGAEANEFYIRMLAEAQKDVRIELIDALRYEPKNVSLLCDLSKTEKGKNKDKVFESLAEMPDADAENIFRNIAKKKPENILMYLRNTTTNWAAELVAVSCEQMLDKLDCIGRAGEKEKTELAERLLDTARALFGKGGTHVCECYRKMLLHKIKINRLLHAAEKEIWMKSYERDIVQYGALKSKTYWDSTIVCDDIEMVLAKILQHSLIINPDTDLQELALELYQDKDSGKLNAKFLSAAVTVKFSRDEDCVDWLEEQVWDKSSSVAKQSKKCIEAITHAAAYVIWDQRRNSYVFYGSYVDVYNKSVVRPIRLQHAKVLVEWLKKHFTKETDGILTNWVALNDENMCREMGEYFYKKALVTEDNRAYLAYMKTCGWAICKGLAVHLFKSNPRLLSQWQLQDYLKNMPGDLNARMEEARTLSEMMKTGEVNHGKIIVADLDKWIEAQ